jgi:hypothetical protein
MDRIAVRAGTAILLAGSALFLGPAQADSGLRCTMHFTLRGWSAFYKTASGRGTITCSDGSAVEVALSSKGGGLTLGKSSIDDGVGEFSGVYSIRDTLGVYASGGAHSTAVDSGGAVSALTKGDVSLALKGTGHGFDAGIDFGKFVITAVPPPPVPVEPPVTSTAPAEPPPAQ